MAGVRVEHNGGMGADHEDTLERVRMPAGPVPVAPDVESTIVSRVPADGTAAPPSGSRLNAPPPVAVFAPPAGPDLSARGRVRIGGDTVVLATPVFIGRDPGRPRIPTPVVRMRVPSPAREISANHLEMRQTGAVIVATDLGSMNGSVVHLVGRPPHRLARGDSIAVPPGTIIELGEGVEVEVLGPAASPAP